MWKGRFSHEQTSLVKTLGESISFDWKLYRHDIRGSIAHARAQANAGLLTQEEFEAILDGLLQIEQEIVDGKFEFSSDLEDIHMNIESELTRRIGSAGAKLHTARSRNDQVATDSRLYAREATTLLIQDIRDLQASLVRLSRRHQNAVLPGYTHLQRAQPVFFAHHLLAYVEMLERDAGRLSDARKRLNACPLGSGAIAGSTINLDREAIAAELEFDSITRNSMDAVSDRDYMIEISFAAALAGAHLSRLSEDIILWCSTEFGFVTLSDAHTTGSSLMPQKKNPDMAELSRGKTGRLYGNLVRLLTLVKGLPMTYNRDLQEDKEAFFDSIDTLRLVLQVNTEMLDGMTANETRMAAAAADPFLLATDLADYLVLKGLPFRQAHEVIGKLTAKSLASGVPFPAIPLSEYQELSPLFEEDLYASLNIQRALEARRNPGAPSPQNIESELSRWERQLETPSH